jgi:hypothetical protein
MVISALEAGSFKQQDKQMSIPVLLFGIVLSTLYGAAFHLWRGGGMTKLILYLILGWVGFWAGHFLGSVLDWTFGSLGQLRLGTATLSSIVFLGVGYWLSLVEVERK